eukprot:4017781-Prymnesium_polylepis.1
MCAKASGTVRTRDAAVSNAHGRYPPGTACKHHPEQYSPGRRRAAAMVVPWEVALGVGPPVALVVAVPAAWAVAVPRAAVLPVSCCSSSAATNRNTCGKTADSGQSQDIELGDGCVRANVPVECCSSYPIELPPRILKLYAVAGRRLLTTKLEAVPV